MSIDHALLQLQPGQGRRARIGVGEDDDDANAMPNSYDYDEEEEVAAVNTFEGGSGAVVRRKGGRQRIEGEERNKWRRLIKMC